MNVVASELNQEIAKRRTFAIISHPDAGKTTITERLLVLGGAIQMAGTVKAKKSKRYATSDWMEIEKKRGISVTSSVLKFGYKGHEVNLIDTPGHQDFSEDTYRTLTAVDSVLMLLDGAAGVEAQTEKLFAVCRMQKTPVVAFINKMDRESQDFLSLLEEIEKVLTTHTFAMTWPVGSGDEFVGVYHRLQGRLFLFAADASVQVDYMEPGGLERYMEAAVATRMREELELLEGAGNAWDRERYLAGELVPVYFGSAMKNLGVTMMFEELLDMAPPPQSRQAVEREVRPKEQTFSAFVFKIQANMDPSHRDRVGFMRVCSGVFERDIKVHLVRLGKQMRLARPTKFMAQDRSLIDKAYPGDIVGVHDPGVLAIGDSFTEGETLHFQDIPVFAPEHFAAIVLKDPIKTKQLHKGLLQLSEEGAVQVFRNEASRRVHIGVVGELQFDVVIFRLSVEYGVTVTLDFLPYGVARWITSEDEIFLKGFVAEHKEYIFFDARQHPVLLAESTWRMDLWQQRNPQLIFHATREHMLGSQKISSSASPPAAFS